MPTTSKFAQALVRRLPTAEFIGGTMLRNYTPQEAVVDAKLQETRAVLESLSLLRSDGSRCFCSDGLYNKSHEEICLRARALYDQLKIEGNSNAD